MQESPLTSFVEKLIESKYQFIPSDKFKAALYIEQAIYTTNFSIGNTIYNVSKQCDFILHHPQKWPECLAIETIWQQVSGSTDEKFPYLVLSLKQCLFKTIILLDGDGYRPQAKNWMLNQVGGNFLHVFNMSEFQKWANKGNL